mmetsp:Transcript_23516/g.49658  ORF Transcript_23516/g.49658 Transcript_23516/m.49658 type:complete len:651 (+) Transcript_23516:166-2118(+)
MTQIKQPTMTRVAPLPKLAVALLASCPSVTSSFCSSFRTVPTTFKPPVLSKSRRHLKLLSCGRRPQVHLASLPDSASSYDIDADENAEQSLADYPVTNGSINGVANSNLIAAVDNEPFSAQSRYKDLLNTFQLSLPSLSHLPSFRPISATDVFCNRELRFDNLRAIGFDMDYTLAQYQQPAFDKLAFDGAKEKLVHSLGYPEEVLDFEYDHAYWVRGLIIDTQRGNFLKIDRHKYVRMAYHGFQPISSNMRKYLYSRTFNKVPSFTEKYFVNMDTLFQHVDAHLFASLVEMKDYGEHEFLDGKTYEEIYRQVRECVDLCHRDGVIKDEVARNPEKYLVIDKGLLPMLRGFRKAGVKVFLLTNSYWEYTQTAMNYLYHEKKVDGELEKKNEWLELFDLVVVGSCKPAYLTDPYLNLFRVVPEDGSLRNTDGLFEIEALGEDGAAKFLAQGKTFQGGNWNHLQAMLDIEAGEEILYVGDHLYADVLRSKRALGWRSCFIMPELPEEMRIFQSQLGLRSQIMELRKLRDELGSFADNLRKLFDQCVDDSVRAELETKIDQCEDDDHKVKEKLSDANKDYHASFHPRWGQMFVAGYQDSRFGYFVKNYACLYTSKATNLGLASTSRAFRTAGELLPHDNLLSDKYSQFVDEEEG